LNYVLKAESSVYYECGFSCDNELFLKLGSEAFFITDARYTTEAKERVRGAEVVEARDLAKAARKIIRKSGIRSIVYDPKEFSCADFEALSKNLKVRFIKKRDFSWKKRIVKSEEEIELIATSVRLNAEAFEAFANFLRNAQGLSEAQLAFEAKRFLTRSGRFDLSFEPIFAIDENAAKPHAVAGSKPLKKGSLVLFDAGIKYERYCSDRTRTSFFGEDFHFHKEQKFRDPKIQRAYDVVRKAQEAAIEGARSGMMAKEIDAIARDIIDASEFKGAFVHSLGHGVGLDIHEMPFINSRSETIIEDGMVFTIEPGIYVPGEFGIRIEDMVVMRGGRAEVL
jgi:Xaa-Pro aminopeptidase